MLRTFHAWKQYSTHSKTAIKG